ncbi:MAG: hypothetical protein PWP07_1518 [Epulopiscium sp.]|jgi:aspartate carbamoyltransferase regulatory subunit|nr:hypothetical protein [Candidatus Epulonipiscium sp.]
MNYSITTKMLLHHPYEIKRFVPCKQDDCLISPEKVSLAKLSRRVQLVKPTEYNTLECTSCTENFYSIGNPEKFPIL